MQFIISQQHDLVNIILIFVDENVSDDVKKSFWFLKGKPEKRVARKPGMKIAGANHHVGA